jgi:hypothetical protein
MAGRVAGDSLISVVQQAASDTPSDSPGNLECRSSTKDAEGVRVQRIIILPIKHPPAITSHQTGYSTGCQTAAYNEATSWVHLTSLVRLRRHLPMPQTACPDDDQSSQLETDHCYQAVPIFS